MAEYDKQYKAKTYNGVEYETDRDYASLAKAAANAGEYDLAKTYEQKRNAKIAGEGLNYETTNLYQDYMPEKQTSTSFDTTTTNKNYNSALNGVVNYQPFSYDVNTDPLYAQYQQQYTRNGQLASDNTLAQVSARTGGLASSYAGQAAQQTYNGYMQELNNKIPELYELAYNKYLQDFSMNQSKLAAQNEYENTLYSRQQDEYNKNMELAQLAAKYGDYSYLQNMGIDTSAMTATTPSYSPAATGRGLDNEDMALMFRILQQTYATNGANNAAQYLQSLVAKKKINEAEKNTLMAAIDAMYPDGE